jgi:drug/metabolite transporter (DMT)-like permease
MTIFGMELIGVTVALSFLYEGLRRTTAIEAQLIANSSPVFIIIGGVLLLKERLERHELVGLLVAVAGILILTLEPVVTAGTKIEQVSLTGNLLVLGYPLMWATYLLLAKKVYKDVSKLLIGFLSLWVGLLSYFFLMWFTTPHLIKMDVIFDGLSTPTVFFASLYMGLLGSIVAVPAYIYGNDKIEASEASLFSYLQPLIAIPLAVVWLGEKLNLIIIIALILITLGVILAERRRGN